MNSYQQRLDRLNERIDSGNVLNLLTDEELKGVADLVRQRYSEVEEQESGSIDGREISGQELWQAVLPFLEEWRAMQAQIDNPPTPA